MQPTYILLVFIVSVLIAGAWLKDQQGDNSATGARDLHRG
jgi:hypothetical protein